MSTVSRLCRVLAGTGALFGLAATAAAKDLVVRPGGGQGSYATIQAAIDAAKPGDRILVRPGFYPGFQVTKSVSILGTGPVPGAVGVRGIAFHPIFPHSGYRVRLSRMTVTPPALDGPTLAFSGNELGAGQLDLDSLDVHGGVFLGVGEKGGFQVTVANCDIGSETPGTGFRGATTTVTGPDVHVEVSRSRLRGAFGRLYPIALPMAALAVDEGATLRIAQSQGIGGAGAVGQVGAPALIVRSAAVTAIHAGALLEGGPGGRGAGGGPGILSDRPVFVGDATVRGGAGTPAGPRIRGRGSILKLDPRDPALTLAVDGSSVGPIRAGTGSVVTWRITEPSRTGLILTADAMKVGGNPLFPDLAIDLGAAFLFVHPTLTLRVPKLDPRMVGVLLHSQGVVLDLQARRLRATTPVTLRFDG